MEQLTRRRRVLVAPIVASAVLIAACGSSEETSSTSPDGGGEGGTLSVAIEADPSSLDPQAGPSGTDHVVLYPMYDTLINFDPAELTPTPGLAESWSYDDETTLRLTLQEGVTFHDGSPLDAAAVEASLERFQEVGAHADLDNVTDVSVDGADVVLTLAQPDSSLLLVLADRAGMVVGPSASTEGEGFASEPVGAGPFQLSEYQSGNRVVFERFDDYWGDDITLDSIEMLVIPDRRAAANALISGQVDIADGLDATDCEQLESASGVEVETSVGMFFDMLYFNLDAAPLDDPRVRQAINHAIDRDELVAGAAAGLGQPAWMPVPEQHWAFDDGSTGTWEHDPDLARSLLEEAGYGDGASFSVVVQSSPTEVRRTEILQSQLAEVGITMEITPMDLNQGVQQYFEAQAFQSAQYAWSGRPDPGQTYYRLFSAGSYQNPAGVELPGVEQLLLDAVATDDLDERAGLYAQINEIVAEEAPYAPLYFPERLVGYSDRVSGYEPNLLGKTRVATLSVGS